MTLLEQVALDASRGAHGFDPVSAIDTIGVLQQQQGERLEMEALSQKILETRTTFPMRMQVAAAEGVARMEEIELTSQIMPLRFQAEREGLKAKASGAMAETARNRHKTSIEMQNYNDYGAVSNVVDSFVGSPTPEDLGEIYNNPVAMEMINASPELSRKMDRAVAGQRGVNGGEAYNPVIAAHQSSVIESMGMSKPVVDAMREDMPQIFDKLDSGVALDPQEMSIFKATAGRYQEGYFEGQDFKNKFNKSYNSLPDWNLGASQAGQQTSTADDDARIERLVAERDALKSVGGVGDAQQEEINSIRNANPFTDLQGSRRQGQAAEQPEVSLESLNQQGLQAEQDYTLLSAEAGLYPSGSDGRRHFTRQAAQAKARQLSTKSQISAFELAEEKKLAEGGRVFDAWGEGGVKIFKSADDSEIQLRTKGVLEADINEIELNDRLITNALEVINRNPTAASGLGKLKENVDSLKVGVNLLTGGDGQVGDNQNIQDRAVLKQAETNLFKAAGGVLAKGVLSNQDREIIASRLSNVDSFWANPNQAKSNLQEIQKIINRALPIKRLQRDGVNISTLNSDTIAFAFDEGKVTTAQAIGLVNEFGGGFDAVKAEAQGLIDSKNYGRALPLIEAYGLLPADQIQKMRNKINAE